MEKERINTEIKIYTELLKESDNKDEIKELKKFIKMAKAELKQYQTEQKNLAIYSDLLKVATNIDDIKELKKYMKQERKTTTKKRTKKNSIDEYKPVKITIEQKERILKADIKKAINGIFQDITIEDDFNYVKKEFIANTSIILKPGTTLSRGSEVTLKIKDIYNLCNSIVTSKEKKNKFEFGDDEYLNEIEDEKFLNSVYKGVLYPNPNSGVFTLYIGNDKGKLSYDIYDNVGKSMYSGSTEKSTLDINLPNLPIGVYIVKLKGDNYKEIIKFIKQ